MQSKSINDNRNDASDYKIVKNVYKICIDCGNFILYTDKEKYCSVCGKELIFKCPDCLEPIIYPVSKFCPVCGTKLYLAD